MRKSVMAIVCLFFVAFQVEAQLSIGQPAYEIVLPDVKGNIQRLSDYRGKVVLVDFWASWCGPCRNANPGLGELYSTYKDKGFEIFGVSIDEKKSAWKKAIAADRIRWKQVIAPGSWEAPTAIEWKIEQIPASFLLDAEGKVIALDPTKEEVESHLKSQLK
jgi:thiol-disulfide isomerase/thioredoxin